LELPELLPHLLFVFLLFFLCLSSMQKTLPLYAYFIHLFFVATGISFHV
jgi:hypothetical protein